MLTVPFILVLVAIFKFQCAFSIQDGSNSHTAGSNFTLLLQPSDDTTSFLEIYATDVKPGFKAKKTNVHVYENSSHLFQLLCDALDRNHLPLLGSLTDENINLIHSFTQLFRVPFFTWSEDLRDTLPYDRKHISREINSRSVPCQMLFIKPDLQPALTDLLHHRRWVQFVYLYTNEASFFRMEAVLHHLATRHPIIPPHLIQVEPYFVDLSNITVARRLLRYVDNHIRESEVLQQQNETSSSRTSVMKNRRIVVDEPQLSKLELMLDMFKSLGMLREPYQYLLVGYNVHDLDLGPYKASGVNITGFSMIDYRDMNTLEFSTQWSRKGRDLHEMAFFLDAVHTVTALHATVSQRNPSSGWRVKEKCSCYDMKKWERKLRSWKEIDTWSLLEEYTMALGHFRYLDGFTGPVLFDPTTCKRRKYHIHLMEFYGDQGSRPVGRWAEGSGWTFHPEGFHPLESLYLHESDQAHQKLMDDIALLKKGKVRVVSILAPPFLMYNTHVTSNVTSGKENFVGYCKDLADKLFKKTGLEYEMHLVEDGKYGAYDKTTGQWSGIVGEIVRGKADVAVAPLTISSSRERDIDFTEPFMTFGLSILMKKPGKTKAGTFGFMIPLSNEIWICIIGASLLVSLVMSVIAKVSPYEWHRPKKESFTFGNSLWFVLSAFVHQSVSYSPHSPGARIVSSVWCFFSLLMIAFYTANLAACISVERLIVPIEDIQEFADKPNLGIKVGTLNAGSTKEFFATSRLYPYNKVYEVLQRDPSVFAATISDAVRRVRQEAGKYAFIMESKMVSYINNRLDCDTVEVGSPFGNMAYAVAISQTNQTIQSIKDTITEAILELREEQELAKLYIQWWIEKGECMESGGGTSGTNTFSSSSLALVNLAGVFYVLIAGSVVAVGVAFSSVLCQQITLYKPHIVSCQTVDL